MSLLDDHEGVGRVRSALAAAGVATDIVVLDDHARTAASAADQLGVSVGQIANSLVFAVQGAQASAEGAPLGPPAGSPVGLGAVLVMTSGAHRVDTGLVAAALGVPRLDRAEADLVRERTGFAIGGVAPVGHPAPLRTLVDEDLAHYPEIWAAAGHPRTVFRTTFDELVRMTGGTPLTVA